MPVVMKRGNNKRFNITIQDESGVPIDLTGAKLWFTVKRAVSDADGSALFQLTNDVNGGITVVNAEAGIAVALVQPSHTTSLPSAKTSQLFYDWKLKTASGELTTRETGTILVTPAITLAST